MNEFRSHVLIGCLAASCLAAVSLVAYDTFRPANPAAAASFQRLVGGLGLGPAVDLSVCRQAFDPRVCAGCSHECGPLLAGSAYCRHHAMSVFPLPAAETPDAQDH